MKQNKINLICFLLTCFMSLKVKAQPMEPSYPAGLFYQLPFENMPEVNLPYFDNEQLLASDTCESCSKKYGIEAIAPFDFWEQSQLQVVNNVNENVEIYRIKIKSPTAEALHVIFEHFELGPNALLFIYSPTDTNRILGAYSLNTNKPNFSFISNRIEGKEMIIEVNRRPKLPNEFKGVLKIKRFIYVYKSRLDFASALPCEINAICNPRFNEFCNQVRSTVKFIWENEDPITHVHSFKPCSGVLVNNLNNDFRPLILTASHCMENMVNEFNTMVFFNFQSNICSPTNNGNDLMTVTGVSLIANNSDEGTDCIDMALMELSADLPLQYNVFFSGWNRRPPNTWPNHSGICFHHPGGDVKKMSDGEIHDTHHCLQVDWNFGTIEGGSSGGPLFISTKEMVAVVSGGDNTTCADIGSTFFSWIRESWGILNGHLAPGNDEALSHTGIDPISSCQPIINLNRRFFPGRDWQIKNQITIQASQIVNVANVTETAIEKSPFNIPAFNSDYIIKAGNHITIFPGFKINSPFRTPGSGVYTAGFFPQGNQNRISFQIAPCLPFIDECGFNFENSMVVPINKDRDNSSYISSKLGFNFEIYPNPNTGSFTVEINDETKNSVSLILMDITGKRILSSQIPVGQTKTLIETSNLSNGIYMLLIKTSEKQTTQKIIINNP